MSTKIALKELFLDHEIDGNGSSINQRIEEIAKNGFPVEFIGTGVVMRDKEELTKKVYEYLKILEEFGRK